MGHDCQEEKGIEIRPNDPRSQAGQAEAVAPAASHHPKAAESDIETQTRPTPRRAHAKATLAEPFGAGAVAVCGATFAVLRLVVGKIPVKAHGKCGIAADATFSQTLEFTALYFWWAFPVMFWALMECSLLGPVQPPGLCKLPLLTQLVAIG